MAYANVGIATLGTGAASSAFTPSWTATIGTTPRTAGDLLICWAFLAGAAPGLLSVSGWQSASAGNGNSSDGTAVLWRVATGGDAAPTLPAILGGTWTAILGEFSGNSTAANPADNFANSNAAGGGTLVATMGAHPLTAGELVVSVGHIKYSVAAVHTLTQSYNNGAADTNVANNNATSTIAHFTMDYGVMTTNGANTSATTSYPGTATQGALTVVSFQIFSGGPPQRTMTGVGL